MKTMQADASGTAAQTAKADLYSRDILRLAASLPHGDRIADAHGSATRRSPVCGSEIAADVSVASDGKVAALAFRARACALGQASAGLLREVAAGRSREEIAQVRNDLAAALSGTGPFDALWPQLACFAPARDHPGRHAAILLPYDALLDALSMAG